MISRLLFMFFVLAITNNIQAQVSKGSVFIGGQISYAQNAYKYENPASSNSSKVLNFFPAFGKAVRENLVVGMDAGYSRGKYPTYISRTISGGVFVRKYFPVSGQFYFFGQGRLGSSYITSKNIPGPNTNPADTSKSYNIGLSFYPGISYAVRKHIHLEAGFNDLAFIGYGRSRATNANTQQTFTSNYFDSGMNLGVNSQLTLGLRFILGN